MRFRLVLLLAALVASINAGPAVAGTATGSTGSTWSVSDVTIPDDGCVAVPNVWTPRSPYGTDYASVTVKDPSGAFATGDSFNSAWPSGTDHEGVTNTFDLRLCSFTSNPGVYTAQLVVTCGPSSYSYPLPSSCANQDTITTTFNVSVAPPPPAPFRASGHSGFKKPATKIAGSIGCKGASMKSGPSAYTYSGLVCRLKGQRINIITFTSAPQENKWLRKVPQAFPQGGYIAVKNGVVAVAKNGNQTAASVAATALHAKLEQV